MENRKFEELIDLIINENEDKAREVFHEIVVEKSREIYENIMAEEMGMDEMVGQTGGLLDELQAEVASEEAGGVEEGEEADVDFDDEAEEDGKEETHDLEKAHDDEENDAEDLEDRVADVEDKLDELMAEFEQIMNGGDMSNEDMYQEEMGSEKMMDEGDHPMEEEMEADDTVEEDIIAEGTTLTKVKVPAGGDNGDQKKSPVTANSGAKGMDSKPVKFSGDAETVPTGPKGPSNAYAKGEKPLPGAGSFKNVPGGSKAKLENAPKPKHGDDGANKVSPVAKK